MFRKKNRRENLSILLIPDDHADPISFRISYKRIILLGIVAVVLIAHIFTGLFIYWRYAVVRGEKKTLSKENEELRVDNNRVKYVYDMLEEYIHYQERVKSALGVAREQEGVDKRSSKEIIESLRIEKNVIPRTTVAFVENEGSEGRLDFLTQTKSRYHSFARNIPTYLPVEGFLTTDFHESSWLTSYRHSGIDIAAKKGSQVHAAADGVVLFSDWTTDLGKLVIVDHLNGFVTYYGHNQTLLTKEKIMVKKGDVIALIGSTGRSTAPHLHFEIRKDGVPLDPKKYIMAFQNSPKLKF